MEDMENIEKEMERRTIRDTISEMPKRISSHMTEALMFTLLFTVVSKRLTPEIDEEMFFRIKFEAEKMRDAYADNLKKMNDILGDFDKPKEGETK
jgi:hypothetical protein